MDRSSTNFQLEPALREQSPILASLLELYSHDFSEFHPLSIGPDGRFGYKSLPLYWSQSNRHPFLIRSQAKLAGFALVKRGSETSDNQEVWDMAEFFILRGCRRHRIGTLAAQEVWRRLPGPWEIRVMQSNPSATSFWTQAISEFIRESIQPVKIEKDGKSWQQYSFRSE
ncbi:GNAT family N-acetyltransferase [Tunturiibacter gelidoferens]|jgi:predicted acetyltransferase